MGSVFRNSRFGILRASLISKPDPCFDLAGTADSTVPSPLPQDGVRKRLQLPLENDPNPNHPYYQDINLLSIPQAVIYPGREPSPDQLAHLLSGLVEQERSFPTPPTLDTPFTADRELEESTAPAVSDLISISPQSDHSGARSDANSTSSGSSWKSPRVKMPTLECRSGDHVQKVEVGQEPDRALTETIKGIYKLWKAERGHEIDKYQFLNVVQKAIEEF